MLKQLKKLNPWVSIILCLLLSACVKNIFKTDYQSVFTGAAIAHDEIKFAESLKHGVSIDAVLFDIPASLFSKTTFRPDIVPVQGRITSLFGWRRSSEAGKESEFHSGIDIAASPGSQILAGADGTVISAGYDRTTGKTVIIGHRFALASKYAHCSTLLVKPGQSVKKGQVIAQTGSTGNASAAHLHYEVHKNSVPVNPYPFFFSIRTESIKVTALHYAAYYNDIELAKLCIRHGAKKDIARKGLYPADVAEIMEWKEIRILLDPARNK